MGSMFRVAVPCCVHLFVHSVPFVSIMGVLIIHFVNSLIACFLIV